MDVSSLNKSFLEDMLRKFEQDNSIVVESFDEKPGTEIFQNFMSTVTKVNVLGKRKENEKIVGKKSRKRGISIHFPLQHH